jgi:heme/copper-type cytochrome/quinol oxidase subunit 2
MNSFPARGHTLRLPIAASAALFLLAAMFMPLPTYAGASQTHTIEVSARTFAYQPGSLTVRRGDTIILHLESLDAVHGLYIDGYGINLVAEPGASATATFVAEREGKFKIRCSVACGALHPFMLGELNVEPNNLFVRALLMLAATLIGALALLWK